MKKKKNVEMVVRSCITFLCDNKINTEIYVQHDELVEQTERLKKKLAKMRKAKNVMHLQTATPPFSVSMEPKLLVDAPRTSAAWTDRNPIPSRYEFSVGNGASVVNG